MIVLTGVDGTNEAQAKRLVVGARLPPSAIETKFLKVERNHVMFHADAPAVLHNLGAPEWKESSYLKRHFTLPPKGRQRTPQQAHYSFPTCLLVFGPAASSLCERLIIINCWLNLAKDQQKVTWKMLKTYFLRPTVSAELLNQYNPDDPKVQGILDNRMLRVKRVEGSQSHKLVHGGNKQKKWGDPAWTNSQLRDLAVRFPEANIQVNLLAAISCSQITAKHSANIGAKYEPILTTVSTAYTPEKGKSHSQVRLTEKVNHFARDRAAMDLTFKPVARALRSNPSITLSTLTGSQIVDSLSTLSDHSFHFFDDQENWPGVKLLGRKAASNIEGLPSFVPGSTETQNKATSQVSSVPVLVTEECFEAYYSNWDDE
jgi:hypothetical protein